MSTTLSRAAARLLVLPVAATVFTLTPATTAHADEGFHTLPSDGATVPDDSASEQELVVMKQIRHTEKAVPVGARALKVARSQAGDPYVYGASGPNAFDCSGLVQWSFAKVGKKLPRTSGAQAGATRRVSKPRTGDLVFFSDGGGVYHVGIYAGNHQIWHAPRPGASVRKERIWTSGVFYGRVR